MTTDATGQVSTLKVGRLFAAPVIAVAAKQRGQQVRPVSGDLIVDGERAGEPCKASHLRKFIPTTGNPVGRAPSVRIPPP